jgi:hypothetical protein
MKRVIFAIAFFISPFFAVVGLFHYPAKADTNINTGNLVLTETNVASKSEMKTVKTVSAHAGTNVLKVTTICAPIGESGRTNLTTENIELNEQTILRTIRLGQTTTKVYKCGNDKRLMELDEDGDGHFETILFITAGEVAGFRRTKAGEVMSLDDKTLQKYEEELSFYERPPRQTDSTGKTICMWNMTQIDGAKQQWALVNHKNGSDTPTTGDLDPYLGTNFVPLKCPKGGIYLINSVNEKPACSIHGQLP